MSKAKFSHRGTYVLAAVDGKYSQLHSMLDFGNRCTNTTMGARQDGSGMWAKAGCHQGGQGGLTEKGGLNKNREEMKELDKQPLDSQTSPVCCSWGKVEALFECAETVN